MDAALETLLAADTPERRAAAVGAVDDVYVDEFVGASIGANDEGAVWAPSVSGLQPTAASIMRFDDASVTG